MVTLIISEKAYRLIMKECTAVIKTETGGILIGRKLDEQFIVPFALGPGLNAEMSWNRFSPDVQWQQIYLDKLFSKYHVNYLGSFHLHPGNYCLPSYQDLKTAMQITSDPEWNAESVVFIITTKSNGSINFHPYYFSRASKRFQLISWRTVTHSDPLIKSILKRGDSL